MSEKETLLEIWDKNDRHPFEAVSTRGEIVKIIGVYAKESKAFGWYICSGKYGLREFDSDSRCWRIYCEGKNEDGRPLVPHWPAVRRVNSTNTEYGLTGTLYFSEDQAINGLGYNYVRLAKELKPIMLPPFQWKERC